MNVSISLQPALSTAAPGDKSAHPRETARAPESASVDALEAEFDKFADAYSAQHAENLAITGERPEYFARAKAKALRDAVTRFGLAEPATLLDFGSGVGASLPFLREEFPGAGIAAFDVSRRSLEHARERFGDIAEYICAKSLDALHGRRFDVIYAACVFHHIPPDLRDGIFAQLRDLLAPGGMMIVFEHNPLNPVTRRIVRNCPFDENASLVRAGTLAAQQRRAGFADVRVRYTGFFPHALRALRPLEASLRFLPIGAQFFTTARG